MCEFEYLIFIGRFQPLHLGHIYVIKKAFEKCKKLLILLGSAQENRTKKNPWTPEERILMFQKALPDLFEKIEFEAIVDIPDDKIWCTQVKEKIGSRIRKHIGLIGHSKDESSYYLRLFPEMPYIEINNYQNISATPIRSQYFANKPLQNLPPCIQEFLEEFKKSTDFQKIA